MAVHEFTEQGLAQKPVLNLDDLCNRIRAYYPSADVDMIRRAYAISEKAHEGQIRRSGEPYISHPLQVAAILSDLNLDLDTIATGLLHDTVEDTHLTLDEIRKEFGESVAVLVDGVTKISQMKFRNSHEKQGENIRKMIVAMGKDVRVVMVKLADRLHNMRTLNHMPYDKQARIAQETLDIYCPLAGRMGINKLKIELEDLCFRYLYPDMYYQLVQNIKKTEAETDRYIADVINLINGTLEKTTIKCKIYGRSKHLWSIYKKMASRSLDYDQVYDVLAFRVVVNSLPECYEILGYIHALWKPIPGRFKDFIAMPKANNYQSLHTTVIGPGGDRIEIQIRTNDMHQIAESGIAAHWKYKERGKVNDDSAQQAKWLRELVQWHQQTRSSEEFLDNVKTDLFDQEIYVFTPKGEVREFPDGSTPLDFAYSVHTDLGNTCVGARINGKMVPLRYQLQNGDTVEIVTSKTQQPSKDWLKIVVTNRAKSKIRAFVAEEQRMRSLLLGKDLLEKEFRKFGANPARFFKGENFDRLLRDYGVHNVDELHAKVGYGKIEPKNVVDRLLSPEEKVAMTPQQADDKSAMDKIVRSAQVKSRKSGSLISVDGMSDVLVHFAKCCHPIPGDPIAGFISRGRGVTVHRSDCSKAFEVDQMRKVEVQWTANQAADGQERLAKLRVICVDTPGLLKLLSEAFAAQQININSAQIRTTKDKKAICHFDIAVKDAKQLSNAIFALQKIKGVINADRE